MKPIKPFYVGAREIMRITGFTKKQLFKVRKDNEDLWTVSNSGGYLYDVRKVPEILMKKQESEKIES